MSTLREKQPISPLSPTSPGELNRFHAEISSFQDDLRRYEANVMILVDLRNRVLDSINSPDAARLDVQREELRRFTSNLSRRMLALEEGEGGAVMDEKRTETALVKAKFITAMRKFHAVQKSGRDTNRQQVVRLLQELKPDVTLAQSNSVLEGGHQALLQVIPSSADRRGDTYQELETRLNQLRKIDYALSEISHHCQDLMVSTPLSEYQDDPLAAACETDEPDLEKNDRLLAMALRIEREHRKIRIAIFTGTILAIIAIVLSVCLPIALLTNN